MCDCIDDQMRSAQTDAQQNALFFCHMAVVIAAKEGYRS